MVVDEHVTSSLTLRTTLESLIREALIYIPDFPVQDFNFPDITPLLERDPSLFRETIAELLYCTRSWEYDTVLCIESFGYVFGVPVAYERGSRIVLMRRSGKLPRRTLKQDYAMCYDPVRSMEIHQDALLPTSRVLVVDDFLVSGGTVGAALELIKKTNAAAAGVACIVEKPSWKARALLEKYNVPIVTLTTIP